MHALPAFLITLLSLFPAVYSQAFFGLDFVKKMHSPGGEHAYVHGSIHQMQTGDNYAPLAVQFPCDVTISCEDLDDLKATGKVRYAGGCGIAGAFYSDETFIISDACYKIKRTWTVKSWCSWEQDSYEDYYTISIQPSLNRITFSEGIDSLIIRRNIGLGDRVTLRYITSGTTEIPGLVEGDVYSFIRVGDRTFEVMYNTTKQESVTITGEGIGPHLFRYANSDWGLPVDCGTLQSVYPFGGWDVTCCDGTDAHRLWQDDGDGYFKFTQIIKVLDLNIPNWVTCQDTMYCHNATECGPVSIELIAQASDECTPEHQLKYSYKIDLQNNGTIDKEGMSKDASGTYPSGFHKVIFTVTDRCGNWNTCTRYFSIIDCTPPTPICINNLSVSLMDSLEDGKTQVWAKSLEAKSSYDNCTDYSDLVILVERMSAIIPGQTVPGPGASEVLEVDCYDLPPYALTPEVEVVVWVGDEAGNWDYCITSVLVQDNMGACSDAGKSMIMNLVTNEKKEGIELTTLEVSGDMTQTGMTNVFGYAPLTNLPLGSTVHIKPGKNDDPLNGLSTLDVQRLLLHILGIKQLQSPYQRIAADVNNSGTITWSDLHELRRIILNPEEGFKYNNSWRFVDASYVFPSAESIFGYPESKTFHALSHGSGTQFIGVKIGDVTGDAMPNSQEISDTASGRQALIFGISDQMLDEGKEVTVAVKASEFNDIMGYQYTLDFNPAALEFVRVNTKWNELSETNFGFSKIKEGRLTTSWNALERISLFEDEVLYTVTFRALTNIMLSQVIKVTSKMTPAQAYVSNKPLLDVQFQFDPAQQTERIFAVYQNEPNPFAQQTKIGFVLPEAGAAVLTVCDITGRVVFIMEADYPVGYNEVFLQRTAWPDLHVLYYTLQFGGNSVTKRMMLLE
ncbi:MAG: hypothetical protein KA479_04135 [Saprospiraceae bacterium]|nr:hypothetical protein [Saprospiraceae bacterium]